MKTEAEAVRATRLEHALSVEMDLEALRSGVLVEADRFTRRELELEHLRSCKLVDDDMSARRIAGLVEALEKERAGRLLDRSAAAENSTESPSVLQTLLRETQTAWSKAAADLKTITASNEQMRAELVGSVGLSAFQAEQSARATVQALLVTEQTVVTKLREKNSELRKELRQWEQQYDHQNGDPAAASQPQEEIPAAPNRRLDFAAEDDDEDEEDEGAESTYQHLPRGFAAQQAPGAQPHTPNRQPQRLDEGASPHYSESGNKYAPRPKEADRIRISSWPKPAGFRHWRMALVDEVTACSATPQRAFEWMLELTAPGVSFESLGETGDDMATLDAKLAAALSHIAPPDFQRALQAKKAEAMKTGRMVTGRQILYMVDQHFKMSEMDNSVYDTEHLFSIKMKGDRLQEFITTWDQVLTGLDKVPDEQTLRALLLRNLRHCKSMEQDLAYYDRLPPGDVNKCYAYLLRTARALLDRNRLLWFRDELTRSIGGGSGWVNPAEKGGGKGEKERRERRKRRKTDPRARTRTTRVRIKAKARVSTRSETTDPSRGIVHRRESR